MSTFLYFIPKQKGPVSIDTVQGLGLGYAFEDTVLVCNANTGPGGKPGTVICSTDKYFSPGYRKSKQTWRKMLGTDIYLGWEKDKKPTEETLIRPDPIEGHAVKLGDGQNWSIPIARYVNGSTAFEKVNVFDGTEWIPGTVKEQYKKLFNDACSKWDTMINAEVGKSITFTDDCNIVSNAMAINYRIGPHEISALGLLTTQTQRKALQAVVDWPTLEEMAAEYESKKKADLEEDS